jgi:hypothetical protein
MERRVGIELERSPRPIVASKHCVDRVCPHGVRCVVGSADPFRASEARRGPAWTLVHDRECSHHRGARLGVGEDPPLTLDPLRRAGCTGPRRSRSTFVDERLSRVDRAARSRPIEGGVMTTGDVVRERALTLARSGTDQDQAVSELMTTCGGRRVAAVRARQQLLEGSRASRTNEMRPEPSSSWTSCSSGFPPKWKALLIRYPASISRYPVRRIGWEAALVRHVEGSPSWQSRRRSR